MPTYTYIDKDGNIYEIKQSIKDKELTMHPEIAVEIRKIPCAVNLINANTGRTLR
jgi:predicted nucleic acid-binding Zn ribbon protein